jgi:hypothetical protein
MTGDSAGHGWAGLLIADECLALRRGPAAQWPDEEFGVLLGVDFPTQ